MLNESRLIKYWLLDTNKLVMHVIIITRLVSDIFKMLYFVGFFVAEYVKVMFLKQELSKLPFKADCGGLE